MFHPNFKVIPPQMKNILIYITAKVIIEMLGYKFHSTQKKQYPPWKQGQEKRLGGR